MIDFDCLCHRYRFSVPAELAGDTIQCPECKRLNDVPTEDESRQIDADGGYKVDLIPDAQELDSDLAIRAYSRSRLHDGDEIDMRQTFDDVIRAGVQAGPAFVGPRRVVPRYDPVTGELIVPLKIKDEAPKSVIPLEPDPDEVPLAAIPIAPKPLEYNRAHVRSTTIAMASAFIQLLTTGNIAVMFFVWVAMLLIYPLQFGGPAAFLAIFVVMAAVLAHYGNVVDEIGPTDRDELPVMLRNASISEDLWWPFVKVIVSLFACFLPTLLVEGSHLRGELKDVAALLCEMFGCFIAPAVLLTMITSGVYANFRPDRVLGVVHICGFQYLIAVATFTAGFAMHVPAVLVTTGGFAALMGPSSLMGSLSAMGVGTLFFAGAVYLTHAAMWQIALLYRAHHSEFPWIMQRHVPVRLAERNRPSEAIPAMPIQPPAIKETPRFRSGLR